MATAATAQAPADEADVKAAFIYNFVRFVDWPADRLPSPADSLVVAIVGRGATADATAELLGGKMVGERGIAVRRLSADQPLESAHVVVIGDVDSDRRRRVIESIGTTGTLTVGESADFVTTGGMIGLLVEGRRVRFDINADAAAASRLRISSKLLALARVVRSGKSGGGVSR